jgi:hypothetical protein
MPTPRDRLIFRIVQKVRGIPVAEFLCKRDQVNSLKKTMPKVIPTDGELVSFDVYEGLNGARQKKGLPIQWDHVETILAGSYFMDY